MYVWPEFLDVPLRDSYEYSPTDRRAKAEMEMGSRYRVLFDTDETVLNCHFILKHEQLMFYEPFERYILKQGSIWFKMPILAGGFITLHTVRFRERPRMGSFKAGYAVVTMVLDVAERNTLSEEETIFLWEMGGVENFLYVEDLLQRIINEKYPVSLPHPPKPFILPIHPQVENIGDAT